MIRLVVDADDPTPPYEQLRRQLAAVIGGGGIAPGDRLPAVRQLAGDLGLAPGTVNRAYRELERASLVVSRVGRGTVVADPIPTITGDDGGAELTRIATGFVGHARLLGADRVAIMAAVNRALAQEPTR